VAVLSWESYQKPLPDAVVTGAEMILGVRLPEAYRSLVQRWPAGRPDRREFPVPHKTGTWVSCIGELKSLDPRHSGNVFACISNLAIDSQLPEGLLPIIDDGGGDLVCLDYRRESSEPTVVYWAHELGGEDAVVDIAPTFQAFLDLLRSEVEDDADEDPEDNR
jgi:hypothetical protein